MSGNPDPVENGGPDRPIGVGPASSTPRWRRRLPAAAGWMAVALTAAIAAFWAFWGAVENFYEGWYEPTLLGNLGLMLVQYLMPALVFILLGLVALTWPRLGALLVAATALAALGFFQTAAGRVLIAVPLALLGVLWWLGRPRPRRWAVVALVALPVVVGVTSGVPGALRVARQVDDGYRGARTVTGNGVTLTWAPRGPGWPSTGGQPWDQAVWTCAHLDPSGTGISSSATGPWRLPTVSEAVASLTLHAQPAGGEWDQATGTASYRVTPDKESPLWDTHSNVIYWWTANGSGSDGAYHISYNGVVRALPARSRPGYLGWRCVRQPG